jgi:hypothetical protein
MLLFDVKLSPSIRLIVVEGLKGFEQALRV